MKLKKTGVEPGVLFLLLIIAGVSSVPLMTDYVLEGSDLGASFGRIEAVKEGLGKVFPIRVSPWPSEELGHAAASFQGDVFYLVPALLRWLGAGLGTAYKLTLLLASFGAALAAYSSFRRCFGSREIGLAGSMLFTWCPCRLNEVYVRGNLGEAAAWTFLPLAVSGLVRLYTLEENQGEYGEVWKECAWGFGLLALSSTGIFSVTVGMALVLFFCMGRCSLSRKRLLALGKVSGALAVTCGWFLAPMLLRLWNLPAGELQAVGQIRSGGMYPGQYLSVFLWGGRGRDFYSQGMTGAQALGPGIGVVLLALLYVWFLYAGKVAPRRERRLGLGMLGTVLVMVWFSSGSFPWDLLQGRNPLADMLLNLFWTPAQWGTAACAGMVVLACLALGQGTRCWEESRFLGLLIGVGAVCLGTTQFFLGNILQTGAFVRAPQEDSVLVPLQVLAEESAAWRLCEAVCLAAVCICLVRIILRRRKNAKKI